jgi:hypothetical protein
MKAVTVLISGDPTYCWEEGENKVCQFVVGYGKDNYLCLLARPDEDELIYDHGKERLRKCPWCLKTFPEEK